MAKSDDLRKIDENDIRSNFEDERTQARIQEHLNNEHDIITEEDIANIQIGAGATPADVENIVNRENELMRDVPINNKNEEGGDNEDPTIETAWNILEP